MSATRFAVRDVLVVGGGLAGSTLAATLARGGREVVLLEKSREAHDKVCGEFLSGEALHYLRQQGVDAHALGAVPLRRVRLRSSGLDAEAMLPFAALSLSRRVLDEALLDAAARAGVQVLRGAPVVDLAREGALWKAATREGEEICARAAFLATGKHDLHARPRPAGSHAGLVAFKMYFRLHPEQHACLEDAVELALFPGGYAGLQPVEGGRANLCLVITAECLRTLRNGWAGLLSYLMRSSAHLAVRLAGAEPLLPAPLALSSIPYGFLQPAASDGLWRVGDQAAVIPSFCGDGMAIALHSAALAAECFLQGHSSAIYQRQLAGQLRSRLWIASQLSRLLVRRPWAAFPARLWPRLLAHVASLTRIPQAALLPPA